MEREEEHSLKKLLIVGLSVIFITSILVGWAGTTIELPFEDDPYYEKIDTEKIIYNAGDEDLTSNGTFSDGIHAASMTLHYTIKDASNISEIIRGIDVIKEYSEGALQLAKEKNASQSIVEKLKEANELIQEASLEKDFSRFEEANKILLKLDLNFNGYGILTDSQFEEIKNND